MAKRIGRHTIAIDSSVSILTSGTVVGTKESDGPLSPFFDIHMEDSEWGEETWEKCETKMQKESAKIALEKCGIKENQIDYAFSGDLLNQCISSGYSARELEVPFYGLYGACSTMIEGLSLGAIAIESGAAECVLATASSHFCTAERQYRTPLGYGGQRPPTAQWTVTGAATAVLQKDGNGPNITHVTTGKVIDFGITDPNNMGGAMAPAAYDTILNHFTETGRDPSYYDMIVTGDLGTIGRDILINMLAEKNYDMTNNYNDSGCMIFDIDRQDVHSGGSGCGCIAVTTCGYILDLMQKKKLNNVLIIGTGALLSPTATLQGESVPGVAHAIALSNKSNQQEG